MKCRLIISILFHLTLIGFVLGQQESDWNDFNLKGKIKSVKQISYKAVLQNDTILKNKRESDPDFENDFFVVFDVKGNKLEMISYSSENFILNNYKYKYDINNNLILKQDLLLDCNHIFKYENKLVIEERIVNNEDSSQIGKTTYLYTKDNKLKEELYVDDISSIKRFFKYKNGKLIEEKVYIDEKNFQTILFRYEDEKGVTEIHFVNSNKELEEKQVKKVDEKNNVILLSSYDINNFLISKYTYEFDARNNIISIKKFFKDDSLITHWVIKYSYDKEGNWVKQIRYQDNVPAYIIERDVLYFD